MLLRNTFTPCLFLFSVLCYSIPSAATAIAIFTSNEGIAIATDSRIVGEGGCQEEPQITKSFVVQGRFAIATLAHICFEFRDRKMLGSHIVSETTMLHYEFSTWVREIESGLPNDASFDKFCDVVNAKLSDLQSGLQPLVAAGRIQPNDPVNRFETFVEFVLVGYMNGRPQACIVQLNIDWQSRTVVDSFQMKADLFGRQRSGHLGSSNAAAHIINRQSYAYKQAMALCPKALVNFLTGDSSSISLNEAIALARISIQIEEKVDPDEIGGDIRVIVVIPSGRAREVSASERLADCRNAKQAAKPKN